MAETVVFRDVARDWWERYMLSGNAEYAEESWRRLEREVLPKSGTPGKAGGLKAREPLKAV